MRIAYVITRADAVGGASIHVRDLAGAVQAEGHEVLVLVGGTGAVTDQFTAAGVPFEPIPTLRRAIHPLRDARALADLTCALRDWRPDLVSTHTAKAGFLGRAACARLGLPAIYTPHGWPTGDRISRVHGLVFGWAERVAARWARAIVCVCEAERRMALRQRIAAPDRLHVIHNGVRDVPMYLRAQPAEGPPRLISVARFEAPKDHRTLLLALAELRDLDWGLDLVGDGPLESALRRLALECGIAERIRFLGYCADPAPLLAEAQIFVLSSRSEGFPRSILEAQRAGLPVVATEVGGVPEAVGDRLTGRLAPRDDVDGLAAALADLIRNPRNRQLFGCAARHLYEQRFRLEGMVRKTMALYAKLLKESEKSEKTPE